MSLERVLDALLDVHDLGAGHYEARCPAHDDHHPSLDLLVKGDGRILVTCRAGCDNDAIVSAAGLTWADFRPEPSTNGHRARAPRVLATYDYRDASGALLRRVERLEPGPDGRKRFRQSRPDGRGGFTFDVKGVAHVPYRLPELRGREAVFVVEGEKDADRLWAIGLPATTNDGGAGKWLTSGADYAVQLAAAGVRRVAILPDHDNPGRRHARDVAVDCAAHNLDVRIVDLLGPEKDVSEWLDGEHTKDDLVAVTKATPLWTPPARDDVATVAADDAAARAADGATVPMSLDAAAFYGLAGDYVRRLDPDTEADPIAVLLHLLIAFGSVVGRHAYAVADGVRHHLTLFAVLMGTSSKGRKGTAAARVLRFVRDADPTWRTASGLSSGEGLIHHLRDPLTPEPGTTAPEPGSRGLDVGVTDKRLCIIEPEFAKVLRVQEREGSTLSAVLRDAWDGVTLQTLTKHSAMRATGAHLSVIGHITVAELQRYLTATETANGFGNRFLWAFVRRSKELPYGGTLDDTAVADLAACFRDAVAFATREVRQIEHRADTRAEWIAGYHDLSAEQPGMYGALTARGEAQVLRLAALYALLDCCALVEPVHLRAARALWDYCARSVARVFGDAIGDPMADELLRALRDAGTAGLSRTEITAGVFRGNSKGAAIERALSELSRLGRVRSVSIPSDGGRPTTRWFVTGYERDEITERR